MTYGGFLAQNSKTLPGSETPFLDASLLLAHCLGISRTSLLGRMPVALDLEPDGTALAAFGSCMDRRRSGESIASIIGRKEFFGRSFVVDGNVLIPRPDTEILVQAALEIGDAMAAQWRSSSVSRRAGFGATVQEGGRQLRLHDACTGSGAVAISIACERPEWQVTASDISASALEIASTNSRNLLGREIGLVQSDLLEKFGGLEVPGESDGADCFRGRIDILTANPPYVSSSEVDALVGQGWKEPRLALDGGPDGLVLVGRLIAQAFPLLADGGFFLVETDPFQVPSVCDMLVRAGFGDICVWQDLSGHERVSGGRHP